MGKHSAQDEAIWFSLLDGFPTVKGWVRDTVVGLVLIVVLGRIVSIVQSAWVVLGLVLLGYPVYRSLRWWFAIKTDDSPENSSAGQRRATAALLVVVAGIPLLILTPVYVFTVADQANGADGLLDGLSVLSLFALLSLAFHLLKTVHLRRIRDLGVELHVVAIDILIRLPTVLYLAGGFANGDNVVGFEQSVFSETLFGDPLWLWGLIFSLAGMVGYGIIETLVPNWSTDKSTTRSQARSQRRTTASRKSDGRFARKDTNSDSSPTTSHSGSAVDDDISEPDDSVTDSGLLPASLDDRLPVQTIRYGISVGKDYRDAIASSDDIDRATRVVLTIENTSTEPVTAAVLEYLPSTVEATECVTESNPDIQWATDPEENLLAVRTRLNPGEHRELSYRTEVPTRHAARQLLFRKPTVRRMEDHGSGGSNRQDDSTPSSDSNNVGSDDTSKRKRTAEADASDATDQPVPHRKNTIDDDHVVDSDHTFLNPPPELDFSDVAGLRELKRKLETQVIEPFVDPQFEQYDVGRVNGVFLHGPPGTGKTYLARALAGELGCNFLTLTVSDVRTSTYGEGVERVREQFAAARANQPCVVLIDEIDSLAPDRGQKLHQSRHEVVNELLQVLSEIGGNDEDVLIVGVSNKPEEIDEAVKRTGRFDVTIEVGMPDAETRIAILKQELRAFAGAVDPVWTDDDFLDEFMSVTETLSASDIAEISDTAKRDAVRRAETDDVPHVTVDRLLAAVENVRGKQEQDTAAQYVGDVSDIDFGAVGGMDSLIETLEQKIIEPLEHPERYEEYDLDTVNGVLLHGPPGTGKTHVSRALAGETDYTFLSVTASDVVSKWVGEAAQNIRDLFDRAIQLQPCILLIDEIDAIAQQRSEQMTNTESQAINELLTVLTDIEDEDVVVVATTNRFGTLDPAVTRAGRVDEIVEVPPPDADARKEILRVHLDGRPVDEESIDWEQIISETAPDANSAPLVAADLAEIADEAARLAMYEATEETQPINERHLRTAIEAATPSLAAKKEY